MTIAFRKNLRKVRSCGKKKCCLVPFKFFACIFEKNLVKVLTPAYSYSPVIEV